MSSIIGIDGLSPTLSIIKHTKKIAIANKESIICGWNLIQSELKENKTEFIPVDSEHFSILKIIENHDKSEIDMFFLYKRKAKLKDFGNFLPGHGGILDRMDGIFFGLPIGFITLILIQ